jgi:hypothetical protein
LFLTFFTNKFEARDSKLTEEMRQVSPILTKRTSMWRAWIGFNASHSLGAILFGSLFLILSLENYAYLKSSIGLNFLLVLVPCAYLALAIKYWFDKPRNGILLALTLIIASLFLRPHP